MDPKMNEMLKEYFAEKNPQTEKEANAVLQEFVKNYNKGCIQRKNTPLDDAYDLLEQASSTKSKTHAKVLAEKAYKKCPACFDAFLFLVNLEENLETAEKMLDEGLEKEKERLTKEGFFEKENIGIFYGIFETRPYIRGLRQKADLLLIMGKVMAAKEVCKEILRLNKSDNTGTRYLLMNIYAYFEEEKSLLSLNKKYHEESLEMLFPLFVYYYKKSDEEKALFYLEKMTEKNSHFVSFFNDTIKPDSDVPDGCYQRGGASEVIVCVNEAAFLLSTVPALGDFILAHTKRSKKALKG